MGAPELLRDRLAQIEEEHATLRSELAAFQSDYLRQVGVVDLQVQELEAKILAIVAVRIGRGRGRRRRRRRPAALPRDDDGDERDPGARRARRRRTTSRRCSATRPSGCTRTWSGDDAGRAHAEAFMKRLNQAYKAGDAEAIGNLVRQWETSPYASARPAIAGAPPRRCRPRSPTPSSGSPRRATPTSPA